MFIETRVLNAKGEKIMGLHQRYHAAEDEMIRESLLQAAIKEMGFRGSVGEEAFRKPDPEALHDLLKNTLRFQPTDESIFEDIRPAIENYLNEGGLSNFEVMIHRQRGRSKAQTVNVERRIGVKATVLADYFHVPVEEVRSFWDEGHAEAFADLFVLNAVRNLLADPPKRQSNTVQTIFETEKTRKYLMNLKVKFLIPFHEIIQRSDSLLYVGNKLGLLDEFIRQNPIFF